MSIEGPNSNRGFGVGYDTGIKDAIQIHNGTNQGDMLKFEMLDVMDAPTVWGYKLGFFGQGLANFLFSKPPTSN